MLSPELCYAALGPFLAPSAAGHKPRTDLDLQGFFKASGTCYDIVASPTFPQAARPLLSLPQPPVRMRNNGLVSAGIHLGWRGLPTQAGQPLRAESQAQTQPCSFSGCVLSTSSFCWFCFILDPANLGQGHREPASLRRLQGSLA